MASKYMKEGQPVISVDTKKKELIGQYSNKGSNWHKKGNPEETLDLDFGTERVAPYGIYDQNNNKGYINLGTDKDTAEFAVASIKRWWYKMGLAYYPKADKLMITADCGGSNGYRVRLWKSELQNLADETGLEIKVCHFPPGTSKWNKIEHRMFSHISMNWRGRPFVNHEIVIKLISSTTTKTGLEITCELDKNKYQTGLKVDDERMAEINIIKDKFHGDWNYKIKPKK